MSRTISPVQRQAIRPCSGLPRLARARARPSTGTGLRHGRNRRSAADRSGRCRMRSCSRRSAPSLPEAHFTAKATARFGRRLRVAGVRTSKRRVLRLMRENDLLAPSRVGSPRGPRSHDGTIIPETVDTMWGTDLTTTITGEGQAAVFIALDHCSVECVGIHAAPRATRFEALEPIRQGVRDHFGGFAKNIARGLSVRHDHGSQYMSDAFQKELDFLGAESSPAFVRAPEGNGCAERFIRTLKENLLWVQTFDTIEDLRQALLAFRQTYNTTWLIERHGFVTPAGSVARFWPARSRVRFPGASEEG